MGLFDDVGRFGVDMESYAVYGLVRKALAGRGLRVCFVDNVTVVTGGCAGDAFVCIAVSEGVVHVDVTGCMCDFPDDLDGVLSDDIDIHHVLCKYDDIDFRDDMAVLDLGDPGLSSKVVGFVCGVCGLEVDKIGD